MSRKYLAITVLLLIAFFLRIYLLADVPAVVTSPELAFFKITNGVFGTNIFLLRFVSVILGTLFIGIFYLLSRKISPKIGASYKNLPIVLTAVITFFPWHIQMSRIDIFGNSVLLLFIIILYFLIRNFSTKIIFVVMTFALLFSILMSFKTDPTEEYLLSEINRISADRISFSSDTPLSRALHHQNFEISKLYLHQFFKHIEPVSLFFGWQHNSGFITKSAGLFYPQDLLFLGLGTALLYRKNKKALVVAGMLAGLILIPSSIFGSSPDAKKIILLLPIVTVIVSLGILEAHKILRNKIAIMFLILFGSIIIARFFNDYYFLFPKTPTIEKEYKNAFLLLKEKNAGKIVIIDRSYGKNMDQYVHFYLNSKMPPLFLYEEPKVYEDNAIYVKPSGKLKGDVLEIELFETQ